MFTYAVDYDLLVLKYGAEECISWINEIFQRLDACISEFRSVERGGLRDSD